MKRILTIFALAAVCLLSCDKKEKETEDIQKPDNPAQDDKDARFWSVVGQLVSMNDITPDYEDKTFTPIIGSPDNGDESIRIVLVNNLITAVDRYNDMVDAHIDESTQTHSFSDPDIGKLTWTKCNDNTAWATVDVDIPKVPSLRKIIYRAPEQGDVNGSVGDDGSAYYRFGDVITRVREDDGVTEYWVCVRPAFDKEGKGDSHWISVSPLPETNIWPYYKKNVTSSHVASNGFNYSFPYSIRKGLEWYQDLVEMLFAIYYPDEWMTNIINYSTESTFSTGGLPIFKNFHKSRIQYHNAAFWSNVQNAWKQKGIPMKVFGISEQELINTLKSERGFHFLYNSYSWSYTFSNTATLYEVQYTYTTSENTKRNMRNQTTRSVASQIVDPKKTVESNINYPFDIKTEVTVAKPYVKKQYFFGDNDPRWIIRYAEGEELAENGKWDPQQPISGFEKSKGGEVYRYYFDVFPDKNLTDEAEISELRRGVVNDPNQWDKTTYTGDHHYELGDVFRDLDGKYWFVIGISGGNNELNQKSPYAELISFDGIQAGSNNAVATNIVNLTQAQRAAILLWYLCQQQIKNPGGAVIQPIAKNIKEKAGVDLEKLMHELVGTNDYSMQAPVEHFSIAYKVEGSTKQNLMRYIVDMGTANEFYTTMWTRYPNSKVSTLDGYKSAGSDKFSNISIYLQDVADASKVSSYGDDALARAPLMSNASVPRLYRTTPDNKANNVTNYFYNQTAWATADGIPLGMWNEPILFFRTTVLYDRGAEYSTKTIDGKDLTLVSKVTMDKLAPNTADWAVSAWADQSSSFRKLNGMEDSYPTWQSVWGSK